MKKIALIVLAFSAVLNGLANPIAVYEREGKEFTAYDIRKQSESCIVLIGSDQSLVSCEVTYRLQEAKGSIPSYFLSIILPAFIAAVDRSSDADIIRRYGPTVEMSGKRYLPEPRIMRLRTPEERYGILAPSDTDIVLFHLLLDIGRNQREAAMLVTYVQPSVVGRFIYVPLFEDHSKTSGFMMDAVAQSPTARLRCPKPISGIVAYADRLRIPLRDQEVIEVEVNDANKAAEPTSTAVTPPAGAGDRASGARGSP